MQNPTGNKLSPQNIKEKLFEAKSGKFLKTRDFHYASLPPNPNGGQSLGKMT